jgi:hypothetical protein
MKGRKITMKRKSTKKIKKNAFARDLLLLEFFKEHKGEQNIVSSKEIVAYLNSHGYKACVSGINTTIRNVMFTFNAPICHKNAGGYFGGQTRSEIEESISDIQKRIVALQKHIEHLNNFIIR